jgi:hypothetical protein
MGHSRVGWMFGAVAPWCLGVGLAVSVPADAGVDSTIGASFSPDIWTPQLDAPADLVPAAAGRIHLAYAGGQMPFREARLSIGEAQDFAERPPVEHEPRRDLKPKAGAFPEANTQAKGDPFVGLRPTFDARLRANGVDGFRLAALTSSGRYLAFEGLQDSTDTLAQMEAAQKLTPTALPEGDTGRSARPGRTGVSPRSHIAGLRVGGTRRNVDGSTPQVARAFAMSSTTPAPFDERLQVVYAPAILEAMGTGKESQTIARQGAPDRPNYAALVNQPNGEREERCLAEAIYFEARSEPVAGQAAGGAQPREKRALSRIHLRRGLPEPPPLSGLPVHLRMRGQSPARHGTRTVEDGDAYRTRGARRHDVPDRGRRLNALPRKLCKTTLGKAARKNGYDWQPHLLQVEARPDVSALR